MNFDNRIKPVHENWKNAVPVEKVIRETAEEFFEIVSDLASRYVPEAR